MKEFVNSNNEIEEIENCLNNLNYTNGRIKIKLKHFGLRYTALKIQLMKTHLPNYQQLLLIY